MGTWLTNQIFSALPVNETCLILHACCNLQVNFKLYQHCKLADLPHLPKLHSTLYILLDILSKKESQIAFPLSQCVCVRERDPQTSCMRDEESERENKFLLKRELSK